MALEDLTGPAKFIDSLVTGNPVSNDDRREGDDHIRGIKNVLRNTFPGLNGAVTITDEQINALPGTANGALQRALNLADLMNVFDAQTNLSLHDPNGHWAMAQPSTPGPTLYVQSGETAAEVIVMQNMTVGAGVVQGYLSHIGNKVQLGNARGAGFLGLAVAGHEGIKLSETGATEMLQKAGATGTLLHMLANAGQWTLHLDGGAAGSGNFLLMMQPGSGGTKYLSVLVDTNLTTPNFVVDANGSRLTLNGSGGGVAMLGAAPVVTGAGPVDAANDASIATAAFVHGHTAVGKGSAYVNLASPTFGTAYQNTSHKPRAVNVIIDSGGGVFALVVSPDGTSYTLVSQVASPGGYITLQGVVPPQGWFRPSIVSGAGTLVVLTYST